MHRARSHGAAIWVGIALTLATAACTRETTSQSSTSPSPSSSSPAGSPGPATAGQDAIAAYRGMWQAYTAALAIPDPSYPDVARYADGDALKVLTNGIKETKDEGLKGEGDVRLSPEVTSVTPVEAPTKVEISDCLDSSGSKLVRASPGPPYSDSPGGKRRTSATVSWQSSGWKVTSFGVQEVGTC